MSITNDDINIVESQIMTNEQDSGGQQTSIIIPSNTPNNVFLPFSRLASVVGGVYSRKFFAAITTNGNEVFSGAHFILTSPPNNPKVHITLFYTGSHTDVKSIVQNAIESYVVRGPVSNMALLETQLQGQKAITVYQKTNASLPEVGDILMLIQNEGELDETEEFVKIQEIQHEERFFEFASISCTKRVVTLSISAPLENTFYGDSVSCLYGVHNAEVRTTQVADAVHYYGISPIAVAGTAGDSAVIVDDIYTQLVPSTTKEQAVIDVTALEDRTIPIESGGETFDLIGNSVSKAISITINNRGYTYVGNIAPLPAPETFQVDYRVLGRWYTINSDVDGFFTGEGSGSINLTTGSYSITLSALPDVDTKLIIKWGTPVTFIDNSGTSEFEPLKITATLGTGAIEPGTVVANWIGGGINYTVYDDGAGAFTGDGLGSLNYITGEVVLYPNKLPDSNQSVVFDFDYSSNIVETFTPNVDGSGFIDVTLANPIKPNSLIAEWTVSHAKMDTGIYSFLGFTNQYLIPFGSVYDNTTAFLKLGGGNTSFYGEVTSTINNGTGQIYFKPNQGFNYNLWR